MKRDLTLHQKHIMLKMYKHHPILPVANRTGNALIRHGFAQPVSTSRDPGPTMMIIALTTRGKSWCED
jgi:hypothetical protein